jgi:glycosyltransferase involved in cell wall biosynthesis
LSYVLVTNIYNEEKRVKQLIDNIVNQTLKPICWVWIDDGSTDNGLDIAKKYSSQFDLSIITFQLPPKKKGNLDTIGRAWNVAHNYIITNLKADYLSIADVDSEFPLNYFESMINFMEKNPDIGVSSGRIKGDPIDALQVPMGGGKIVRWKIIRSFHKYWDIAPDSFLNIKAECLGYRLEIRNVFVKAAPMTIHSEKGRYRYGRRSYYIGKSLVLVINEALKLLLSHKHGTQFLRGYWFEWGRGEWRCDDPDVQYYYSLKRQLHQILHRMRLQ